MKVSDKYSMTAYSNTAIQQPLISNILKKWLLLIISSQFSMPSDGDHHKFSGLHDC